MVPSYSLLTNLRGLSAMSRKARIFMFLSFAFINFFLFKGVGIHALGLVFLIPGIQQLVVKPKAG
jgi:hypothetical protein